MNFRLMRPPAAHHRSRDRGGESEGAARWHPHLAVLEPPPVAALPHHAVDLVAPELHLPPRQLLVLLPSSAPRMSPLDNYGPTL
jgi:hypothetical protein